MECFGNFSVKPITEYCPAIQSLLDEHPILREQMSDMSKKGQELIKTGKGVEELIQLEKKFRVELDVHAEKEEGALFPMVGKYIGTETGPIAVMEYEHEQAKNLLVLFEEKAQDLTEDTPSQLANILIDACNILSSHFDKEEQVLFPAAENMLSVDEKDELFKMMGL